MSQSRFLRVLCAAAVWSLAPGACTGQIQGDTAAEEPVPPVVEPEAPGVSGGGSEQPAPAPAVSPPARCDGKAAGPAPLRRLTRAEYDRTVADLLGDTSNPARAFVADARIGPFETNADALPSDLVIGQYRTTAEKLATGSTARSWRSACPTASPGCADRFIADFGRRAFRRPLVDEERGRYRALFDGASRTRGQEAGARLVVQAMLQSPHFLYRVESWGPPDAVSKVARLDSWSMASRLSYFLWRSMPDAELLAAAGAGRLVSAADIEAQARRLLTSTRARDTLVDFHEQWLGLHQLGRLELDRKKFPLWDGATRAAMQKETADFIEAIAWKSNGGLEAILTSPLTVWSQKLGALYGVTGSVGELVRLDPTRRAGLLTHPAFLTVTHGPILRGKAIRKELLCEEIPPPPPGTDTELPARLPNQSPRQRLEAHATNPACGSCHQLMDPLGFAFDHYDDLGVWRDQDEALPIDATGTLTVDAREVGFDGGVDLMRKLAGTDQVRRCAARQWLRYALARGETATDACAVEALTQSLTASHGDLRELIVAITRSDAFSGVRANAP